MDVRFSAITLLLIGAFSLQGCSSARPAPRPSRGLSSPSAIQPTLATPANLQAKYLPKKQAVEFTSSAKLHWYRSTQPIDAQSFDESSRATLVDLGAQPVKWSDRNLPQGVRLFYAALDSNSQLLEGPSVDIPDQPLGQNTLRSPRIEVDKKHYILRLYDGEKIQKCYPVAFGRDPVRRKLQEDQSTTPEGRYTICNLQAQATYHKAFDVDYPSPTDKARFELLAPAAGSIGGEIQIHGKGISRNWTWGCIAMRNQDIDELFAVQSIRAGCPLLLYGGELTREDLLGPAPTPRPWSPREIGVWQQQHGLKVTCLWDRESRRMWSNNGPR